MSQDLRARILDAAIKLLEHEGLNALRQTRVAKEAGVEQGHLTYYFPRRADLVSGVFGRASERAREEVMKIVVRSGPDGVRRRFFEIAKTLAKDAKRTRLLFGLIVESHGDPDLTRPIAETFRMQRQAVAAMLGREADDVEVELGVAALRGIGLEHMVMGTSPERVDALVGQLEKWLARAERATKV